MIDLKKEVIFSFNEQVEMILKMKKNDPDVIIKLTLCTFNDTVDFKFVEQSADHIRKLNQKDYQPDSFTALYDAIGASFVKISELTESGDQVFFAIFTDGLENASKFYTAEDIKYKINWAEKNGWSIKFFCRYEDQLFYRSRLNLSEKVMFKISLNQDGLSAMENEICYSLREMAAKQKKPTP
jgi:hypothetical protein